MAARVQSVQVTTTDQLQQAVSSYIVQGYSVANQTATSATMVKKKEFSVLWLVIGLILCLLPLLIYVIVYAAQSDSVIEIRVVDARALDQGVGSSTVGGTGDVLVSDDGHYWWDGAVWRDASAEPPRPRLSS